MNNVAVILGAGAGTRMKQEKSKLLLEVCGKTVIERTVEVFSKIEDINEIIVVCRERDLESFEAVLSQYNISYCFGGDTRQKSVANAVETIDECDYIMIHDGARPLITEQEIQAALESAVKNGAAAVGVPVKDTIKVVDKDMKIVDTPDRSSLISIRTPQVFEFRLYLDAMELAEKQNKDFTDDCQLIENYGKSVFVVDGDYGNIKITTPEDIPMAESIVKMRGEN
ncbi:MAG: 2-C-methyl-D-erythritol 4-phosphate cytidylyltransferase [Clostridium sp.]|nr:2-C-methyl-D-erythritol 4-phosphate cytidylyltransferase [Clostridium sp.]